jgi:hypothetical protein
MFGEPYADFGEEFLGDVDRAGLARFLKGEVLARVQGTAVVAATGGTAAAVAVGDERSGQDWGLTGQLLETTLEHQADAGRVVRDAHGSS